MRDDDLFPAAPETLARWLLADLERGQAFGIPAQLFFRPDPSDPFRTTHRGIALETPLGAAAGPHTQMAQNIATAWLCGARYIELKTVQANDRLTLTKPCINALDEGYNCAWSQDLRVGESREQYLAALVMILGLRRLVGHPGAEGPGGPGFAFDVSVGYDLQGIESPPMRRFLDGLTTPSDDLAEMAARLAPLHPAFRNLPLPERAATGVTISTMHGCPPEQTAAIARHFLAQRRLDTTIKLNPTLLGPDFVRSTLDSLGYGVEIPDSAFAGDLGFDQALELIGSLAREARDAGVRLGLKLTNTLEVFNRGALPGAEAKAYLSGRALHPLAVNLAAKLRAALGPGLPISFCAGVDALNAAATVGAGLSPATLCTELLKPGGYLRLRQCLEALREAGTPPTLDEYAAATLADPRYRKDAHHGAPRRIEKPLPVLDCYVAPCRQACGAGQDVPGYLSHAAAGDWDAALAVVGATNAFPGLLAKSCDRLCQGACVRAHQDRPVDIRAVKRGAVRFGKPRPGVPEGQGGPPVPVPVAVDGAGLEGLSCAVTLARAGHAVHVFGAPSPAQAKLLAAGPGAGDLEAIAAAGVRLHPGEAAPDGAIVTGPLLSGAGSLPGAVGRGMALARDWLAARNDFSPAAQPIPPALAAAPAGAPAGDWTALTLARSLKRAAPPPGRDDIAEIYRAEAASCLRCDTQCNACVSVCPNRANLALPWHGRGYPLQVAQREADGVVVRTVGFAAVTQRFQVVNVADLCNRCGNCQAFCPWSQAPWQGKYALHMSLESFAASGRGVWFPEPGRMEGVLEHADVSVRRQGEFLAVDIPGASALLEAKGFHAARAELAPGADRADLALAARAALLYTLVSGVVTSWESS